MRTLRNTNPKDYQKKGSIDIKKILRSEDGVHLVEGTRKGEGSQFMVVTNDKGEIFASSGFPKEAAKQILMKEKEDFIQWAFRFICGTHDQAGSFPYYEIENVVNGLPADFEDSKAPIHEYRSFQERLEGVYIDLDDGFRTLTYWKEGDVQLSMAGTAMINRDNKSRFVRQHPEFHEEADRLEKAFAEKMKKEPIL